jgi:hypothetical protein
MIHKFWWFDWNQAFSLFLEIVACIEITNEFGEAKISLSGSPFYATFFFLAVKKMK